MKSVLWGFLPICHRDSEGWPVWHQAGGDQVVVLGGTKIPTGIRESGVLHSREQHRGVPAERGKLRQRRGVLSVGSFGTQALAQGSQSKD